jgi:hypothetical protein
MPLKTCASCLYLKINETKSGMPVGSCTMTGQAVPQNILGLQMTFWRVPMACPLTPEEVFKSEHKADPKDWEVIHYKPSKEIIIPII